MPRMSNWIHAKLVYPAIVRARGEGEVFAALEELRAVERLTPEELRARQERKLAAILDHAAERCAFYRERWPRDAPFAPGEALDRLADLPVIRKRDLQDAADRLRANPAPRRITRKVTGGSTGQTVTVYKDRRALAHEMAASWLGYGWFGVRIGDRAARFWGSPHTLKRRLRFAAADFAMHRIRFSAFAFGEDELERYWKRCLRFRPQYFYGYVSMLEEFARYLRRRGHDGAALGLKAVITTSEVLLATQREVLQEVFNAPVQNEYGCGEVGAIAYECERGSLHIMGDNLIVELITPEGKPAQVGETGEVVVTDLNNRAMPLIRYALADFGVPGEPCDCGRPFPVLERIWGREYDFVESPSGRRYHGEFLMYFFEDLRARGVPVQQFQVIQHDADRLEVAVILPGGAGEEERVGRELEDRLPGMKISVRRVDAIERAPSGKMHIIQNPWLRRRDAARQGA